MSELTPEQVRAAADVVTIVADLKYPYTAKEDGADQIAVSAQTLRNYADAIEREQAEKAKRDKRVGELAEAMYASYSPRWHDNWEYCSTQENWRNVARLILDRHPYLLAEPMDGES